MYHAALRSSRPSATHGLGGGPTATRTIGYRADNDGLKHRHVCRRRAVHGRGGRALQ